MPPREWWSFQSDTFQYQTSGPSEHGFSSTRALTFEAESVEKAVDVMKGVLNLTENEAQIPDELNLYMTMNEITSLVQNTDDAENDKDLYRPIYKWYASFGLPSSWYFIPVGVALGLAINLL